MKKLLILFVLLIIAFAQGQPRKKVQWNDLEESVKDLIRESGGSIDAIRNEMGDTIAVYLTAFANDSLTAGNGVVYEGRNFSADTTFLTTWEDVDSLIAANINYIVLELSASANVWNRTVTRNSVTLSDAGADTLYFNIPTFRYLTSDFMIVDSIDFYIDSDNATTVDSVKIVSNVAGGDVVLESNTTEETPSASYAKTTISFTPVGNGSVLPKQIAMFLTVDTEIIFYTLNVYTRIGSL